MFLKIGRSGPSREQLLGPGNRMCKGSEDEKGVVHRRKERVGSRGRNRM